jgi:hypothetical protein
MQGISEKNKAFFRGRRYMDDVILMLSKSAQRDRQRFLSDFVASDCCWPPLKLETSTQGVFLKTRFETSTTDGMRYRLKNDNEKERKVWRYHHYSVIRLPDETRNASRDPVDTMYPRIWDGARAYSVGQPCGYKPSRRPLIKDSAGLDKKPSTC